MDNVDQSTKDLVAQVNQDAMASWSDERRKDFVKMFRERVVVSVQILQRTSHEILVLAHGRQLMGVKHSYHRSEMDLTGEILDGSDRWNYRPAVDTYEIAKKRAQSVLDSLPPLKKAMQVIDADTAKLMDERDKLLEKGKTLLTKYNEMSEPMEMSDFPKTMTLAEFTAQAEEREKKRRKLVIELNSIGEEGAELQFKIDRAIVKGVPGIKEAVLAAAKKQQEKAKGLVQLCRRVEEQVMFGDSVAAMELLKKFEQDEEHLEEETKKEVRAAMQKIFGDKLKSKKLGRGKKS